MQLSALVELLTWLKSELGIDLKTTQKLIIFLGIMDNEGIEMNELHKRTGITQTTLSRHVKNLEKKNLVHKYPHPDDGRVSLVGLTIKVKKMKEEIQKRLDS